MIVLALPEVIRLGRKDLLQLLFYVLCLLPGILLLLSGVASLARARKLAQWFLFGLAIYMLGFGALLFYSSVQNLQLLIFCLTVAVCFFFLGRWIGHQTDTED